MNKSSTILTFSDLQEIHSFQAPEQLRRGEHVNSQITKKFLLKFGQDERFFIACTF